MDRKTANLWTATSALLVAHCGGVLAQAAPAAQAASAAAGDSAEKLETVIISGSVGKGETRANSVLDRTAIQEQPAGLDPLKLINRVPGLQVSSSDGLTGSFSMRLMMRGLNKEQVGISVDGIPNGSTLSNGGTLPNRLLDPANLARVDVSQSSGEIGTPSNQALGGFIDYRTRDPSRKAGAEVELSAGNYGYQRQFVRYDTGELGGGLRAFADVSHNDVRTWPGDQSGRSERVHADVKVLKEFGSRAKLTGTVSYNDMKDNDYDAVALNALSKPFYKANFESNPDTDALTDAWTGNPALDQNNRRTRGIASKEWFAHLSGELLFGEGGKLTVKPYYHGQNGAGSFYVPYRQLPANGVVYSPVAAGGRAVATVQECYANQYRRDANGALIPVAAVTYPTGVSAATLSSAGCPAAARYAMNERSTWGAREATARRGGYDMDRKGVLGEISQTVGEVHELRAGAWFERIDRTKTRNWYGASDPLVSDAYDPGALYSVTQDRQYRSQTHMAYLQDKLHLLNDKLELSLGVTYQHFKESYRSAVEFYGERELAVQSGLLPKIGALYQLSDQWEAFASRSKNFSALPDTVFEGTAAIDSKGGIKPETSINTDLGLRWTGRQSSFAVQLYTIDYRDRISIQNGNPNGDIFSRDATTTFLNQGGIKSRGVELVGRTAFGPVELYANYAYNNAYYVADTLAEGIHAGDPVLGAARHNAFAELSARPLPQLRVTGNVKYLSKAAGTYGAVTNTTGVAGTPATYPRQYMPAYALVGLSASYKLGETFGLKGLEFALNVDNLLDKRYLGGVGMELTSSDPLKSGRYFLGSPRTLYFTLRAQL